MTTTIVEIDDYIIRPFERPDAPEQSKILNNPRILQWMTNIIPNPYTLADSEFWINFCLTSDPPTPNWAIACKSTGLIIGGIGYKTSTDIHRRTVELGYWLGEPYWNKGIISLILPPFLQWTWEAYPHVNRIEASVYAGNEPSGRALKRVGFELEGRLRNKVWKNEKVMDLLVFGLLREEEERGGK
jgi:ribosomal-protein-alanine N-acetyltransferase